MTVDTMTLLKICIEVKIKVNEQRVVAKLNYFNYITCGLAHVIVACFCNVCVTEKKAKALPHTRTISKMVYI